MAMTLALGTCLRSLQPELPLVLLLDAVFGLASVFGLSSGEPSPR